MLAAMYSELVRAIEHGADILLLCAGMLRLCREHLSELHRLDCQPGIWREREVLRRRCEEFFRAVDDEELDVEERAELCDIALEHRDTLPAVIIAHTIADAVDLVLGSRFLPMFMGRKVVLEPGDPIPVPHADWRRLARLTGGQPWSADSESWSVDDDFGDRLDATTHLCLAADWAGQVRVTLDGNWRRWHLMPQLERGDRLACATPNQSLAELVMERGEVAGTPVFFDAHWGGGGGEQLGRCLALLDLARDHGCRLVAFPELSVAEPARQAIQQWLEAQDVVDLIVAGSSHRPAGQGRWHNEAAVYVRGLQAPLLHRKFRPSTLPDPGAPAPGEGRVSRREHLADSAPALTAQLSPHWTSVVLVSADAVDEPVPAVLADVRANLVLVPALGLRIEDYQALARALAIHCQAVTLVASACVAMDRDGDRPPVIIGLPSRPDVVIAESPPARALLIATLGSLSGKPSIVQCPDTTG